MSISTVESKISVYGRRVVEQARRLNKHPNTLYRLIRQDLPATLVGNTWYIRDEDLDSYFAKRSAARLGKSAPAEVSSKSHDEADAALTAAGW